MRSWPNLRKGLTVRSIGGGDNRGRGDAVKRGYGEARILAAGFSINGLMANWGLPTDYGEWSALGADGWEWTLAQPYFHKLETDLDFDAPATGSYGPIAIRQIFPEDWTHFTKSAAMFDGADIDLVASRLPPMLLSVNRQLCIAQIWVRVPRLRANEMIEPVLEAVAEAVGGDLFEPSTNVEPLGSATQPARAKDYIRVAWADGASVTVGGARPVHPDLGFYVEPTVFVDVTNGMRIAREEVFGSPVMSIIEYDDEKDAVEIANDTIYGRSGSVWIRDISRTLGVAAELRTGMVSLNGAPQAWETPFGGFKRSGLGREMGPDRLKSYLALKSIARPN